MPKKVIITAISVAVIVGLVITAVNLNKQRISVFGRDGTDDKNADISVLVLGRVAEGQGGKWHLAPKLVDAVVLVYYRHESETINLISLPRDLYGTVGDSRFKINEIYSRGKVEDFLKEVPSITGIETDKFLILDAGIIEKAVDELGGVDVEITSPVTDPVSGYRLEEGVHHLSGEDIVWLIRNRYSPEGDFFREKNQQVVIEGIFRQYNSLSPAKKTRFLFDVVPEIKKAESNFSLGELIPRLGDLRDVRFNGIVLDFSTGLLKSSYIPVGLPVVSTASTSSSTSISATGTAQQSAYVLIPTDGTDNYTSIRQFIVERIK